LHTNDAEILTPRSAELRVTLLFKGTRISAEIFASEDFVEFLAHRADEAARLVFRVLLFKVINYIDVDGFLVFVEGSHVERFERDIPHQNSIVRVLAVVPMNCNLCQVRDSANELIGEVGTDSEYLGTQFRFELVCMRLDPLGIPDKRNGRITDVIERRIGFGPQGVQDCVKEFEMAEALGRVEFQRHFVVSAGVSLGFDLVRYKKQVDGWRAGVDLDNWKGVAILCVSANGNSRRRDGY